jgi:RNA polymerase sigma factor (sigma-70 family)
MLGDYDDASDATQAAFVRAYGKLGTFDRRFRFFSWLYRILLNECLNARRGRRPHEQVRPEMAMAGSPLEALEAAERRRRVQHALLALSREVIVLRHFAELGYDDIAVTLGIPRQDRQVAAVYGPPAAPRAAGGGEDGNMNDAARDEDGGYPRDRDIDRLESLLNELKETEPPPPGLVREVMSAIGASTNRRMVRTTASC